MKPKQMKIAVPQEGNTTALKQSMPDLANYWRNATEQLLLQRPFRRRNNIFKAESSAHVTQMVGNFSLVQLEKKRKRVTRFNQIHEILSKELK